MSSGPDTSKTAEDLLIRLAEWDGSASYVNDEDANDNRARVPTNPHDLDILWRALNDAIECMSRGATKDGYVHEWRCLMYRASVSIDTTGTLPYALDGRTGVYALPWYFDNASPATDWWCYTSGTTLVSFMSMTDIRSVRTYLLSNPGNSRPIMAAVVPGVSGAPGASNRKGWQLHVAPLPDQAYTLETEIRLRATKLESLGDRHVFGALHDETILALAKWVLVRDKRADPQTVADAKAAADEALALSIRLDLANTPTNLGTMTDPGISRIDGNTTIADRFNVDLYGTRVI